MSRYTFLDTLNEIEKRAHALGPAPSRGERIKTTSGDLRALADDLRKLGESTDELTYEELYAVQSGSFAVPDPSQEPPDEGPGASLRKLAHELRRLDRDQSLAKVARAKDLLIATGGLTILRERLGSTT
jgi:hypothetical protein